jgi:hypothetical protein
MPRLRHGTFAQIGTVGRLDQDSQAHERRQRGFAAIALKAAQPLDLSCRELQPWHLDELRLNPHERFWKMQRGMHV